MLMISIRFHRPRTWGTELAAACITCQNLIDARVRAYRSDTISDSHTEFRWGP